MIAITCFSVFAFINLVAAESVQHPNFTQCDGTDDSLIEVQDVSITNAKLGEQATIDVSFTLKETSGENPVLTTSFSTRDGKPLNCIHMLIAKQLRLCDGDTPIEQEIAADWNSECPVPEGEHHLRLSIYLPNMILAKMCVGDGQLNGTFQIIDEGSILDCVSFPFSVDVGE